MILRNPAQSWSKKMPCSRFCLVKLSRQHGVDALDNVRVALELADDRAGVDMVDTRHAHPFGDHAEGDAMGLLPRIGAVPGAMQMQEHVVAPRPFRHGLDRRVADHEVDHDDAGAQFLRELGTLVHVLHRAGGDVEVMPFDFAGRRGRLVDRLHAVQEAVAPVHERLGVDVLVVLDEIESALQRLVDDAAVILAGEAELGLGGRAEERAAELVEPLALDDDAGRRTLEGLQVGDRYAHVLETQRLQRLEAEDVADDRCGQIGDRSFFK